MLENLVLGEAAPSTAIGTIIVVSGSFLILMLLIKKFAWGAITDVLKKREDKISNDLDSAEKIFDEVILLNKKLIAKGPASIVLTGENLKKAYSHE